MAATTALMSACIAACGSANSDSPSASARPRSAGRTPTANAGYLADDGDADNDDSSHPVAGFEGTDTLAPTEYGTQANKTDETAITALVKRYYAAAAAGNAAAACPLLYSTLAIGLSDGRGGAREACAKALSLLFTQQHALLAADDVANMTVVDVHVEGNGAIATVGFRTMPVGELRLRRERGSWKLDSLLDTGIK